MALPIVVPKENHPPIIPNTGQSAKEKLSEGWRYVDIPDVDLYEFPFEGFSINNDHFGPGKHLVPPDVAESLEERLAAWRAADIRLMRPGRDKKTSKDLDRERKRRGVTEDAPVAE